MIVARLCIFFSALLTSLVLTRFFIWLSYKTNFLDVPRTLTRKNHAKSTPLLGGPAVFMAFFLTLLIPLCACYLFKPQLCKAIPSILPFLPGIYKQSIKLTFILMGGALILLLGLKDDRDGVGPGAKLGALLFISILLYYLNLKITLFLTEEYVSFLLTLAWIVFLTNSFNLLDNMDGLSAGTAVACSVSFLTFSLLLSQHLIALFMLAFIGSLLGFLRFNLDRGRIFLGDSGSLFIGYTMAVAAILQSFYIAGKSNVAAVFIPAFVFAVPFYDTLSVIVIRIRNGQPIYKGDLNHFSHRLNRSGFSKLASVLIIISLALLTGLSSIYILNRENPTVSESICLFFAVVILLFVIEKVLKTIKGSLTKIKDGKHGGIL